MKIYRLAQYNSDEFLSWFNTSIAEVNERTKHKVVGIPESRTETLTLYRGFDYLPDIKNGEYILSPQKSDQSALWFTHNLISRNIDPIEYASSHGKYLLTYSLNVIKHFQTVTYENSGENYEEVPKEIVEKTDGLEDCRFHMGYELPLGWFFSYKMEKFIICDREISVLPKQIKENK